MNVLTKEELMDFLRDNITIKTTVEIDTANLNKTLKVTTKLVMRDRWYEDEVISESVGEVELNQILYHEIISS